MTKTRTARTVCTAMACLAAASVSIGMILRTGHALAINQIGNGFATKPEIDNTFTIKQGSNALAIKPVALNTLETMPDGGMLMPAISDAFAAKPNSQFLAKLDSNAFAPKHAARNAVETRPAWDTLATKLETYDSFAIKLANNAFSTKPVTFNALGIMPGGDTLMLKLSDAFAAKQDDDTLSAKLVPTFLSKPLVRNTFAAKAANDPLAIKFSISDAFVPERDSQLLAKPNGNAFAPKRAAKNAFDAKPKRNASATKPAVKSPIANKPDDHRRELRNANAISRATMENKWQYWQYCLAPLHAEHKIYLSPPIPLNGYLNGADAAFDQVLKKAGLAHDEVQCPRAPNKPTLLFRQKYSISFNKEIGNMIINVNWGDAVD